MAKFLKRNINGILGTILFHLIILVVAMGMKLSSPRQNNEEYIIIEPETLEEFEKLNKKENEKQNNLENFDIENYLKEIRNVGGSNPSNAYNSKISAMSEDELRQKYESEILKEKYGSDYEKMKNSTYEDYLKGKEEISSQTDKNLNNNTTKTQASYAGPALVFVELQNPNRGKTYIHVPVFTCENGGRVVIDISIAPDGSVKSATINSAKSNGDASCISNAAKEAALKSKFSPISGGKNETGTITYSFIEQ